MGLQPKRHANGREKHDTPTDSVQCRQAAFDIAGHLRRRPKTNVGHDNQHKNNQNEKRTPSEHKLRDRAALAEVLDQFEALADQVHLRIPAAVSFEVISMVVLPAFQRLVLTLGQRKVGIDIAETLDGNLGRA